MLHVSHVDVLLSPVQTEGQNTWHGHLRETLKLDGSIALYGKINYRLPEQVGFPQSSCPYGKMGIKNLKVTHKTLLLGKNCCSAMKMKESK